ncbi:DEAD/DEAH box helicase [Microbacterium sp. NPDC003461]
MSNPDFTRSDELQLDIDFGYLSKDTDAPRQFNPRVVLNTEDIKVLHTLAEEIRRCDTFTFSVAFVSSRAIQLLKQEFANFAGKGRIITSDYLGFNAPTAFDELLNLGDQLGIEVRLHDSRAFHPKGYIFESARSITAMMGSSNLTHTAIASNHEWNLKVTASRGSDLADQISRLVTRQIEDSKPLTRDWIEQYRKRYVPPTARSTPTDRPDFSDAPDSIADEPVADDADPRPERVRLAPARPDTTEPETLCPNRMQQDALHELARVRAEGANRAIVVSATGTGKTILSAFDVHACAPKRLLFVVHREQILDRSIAEYHRVLGGSLADYGKFTGNVKQQDRRYVFSTVQTLSRALDQFRPDEFDYVVIDEAHRAGAEGHLRVLTHFTPKFMLGMTATPERTDAFNVFELFNYVVPYEIRLQHALEEGMLAPFHYYGVADVTLSDGTTINAESDLSALINPERIDHVIKAIELYGQAGVAPRGLIFCSRQTEAHALSSALNERTLHGKPLRTIALTGSDSMDVREAAVGSLERGELDYILTVDIFNEGVDIPSVNQVIMLRQTQSPIVFVQQLGRGLRKAAGKEYLVVIDFIGNYANNFMIPIALYGDETLNKESLRKDLVTDRGVLPGLSSISFDQISKERVLAAIQSAKLTSAASLRRAVKSMFNRLGREPLLWDFWRFESTDPVVLATHREHFPALVASALGNALPLTDTESKALQFITHELLVAKRPHELVALRALLESGGVLDRDDLAAALALRGASTSARALDALIRVLTLEFQIQQEVARYGAPIIVRRSSGIALSEDFTRSYAADARFAEAVDDAIQTGLALIEARYAADRPLKPGMQYTRKDACRLLGWDNNEMGAIFGYKVHRATSTCPIFITLHKDEDVSASTAYDDELLDASNVHWFTRSRRTLATPEVRSIIQGEVDVHVFVKKDDAEGADFYYLGQAHASNPMQTTMPDKDGSPLDVVHMNLRLESPMPHALYAYFHPSLD